MKKILFFVLLTTCSYCAYTQSGLIITNDSCYRIINEYTTLENKKSTTFFSQCLSDGFYTIFSIVNDTIDGNYYEYYPSGVLKCWYVFKMGRFMELRVLSDSSGNLLCPGTLKNGYGYINRYDYCNWDGSVEFKKNVQSRMYYENGLYTGTHEYLDNEGNVVALYDCECSDVYYYIIKENYDEHRDFIVYIPNRNCNEDTLLILFKNKIVGAKRPFLDAGEEFTPDQFYIPDFYQTKENIAFLKKVKRKLTRLYRKEDKTKYENYIKRNLVID